MSAPAIALRGVTRRYGARAAVQEIDLALEAGQATALLGPSGSGKSTILRLIAGLEPLDAGEIRLGETLASRPGFTLAPELRKIGLVFQDYALFPHLSALENVTFGLSKLAPAERRRIGLDWLDRVGLAARANAYPQALSGGEQQRVALARALAPGPHAVLLDEPFSGLDPGRRVDVRETALAAIAASGAAAVFVTHDADEALLVADRLAIIEDGRLIQVGAPRAVYDRPASLRAAMALGPVNAWTTTVRDGAAATPFGTVAAPGFAPGATVTVAARAETLQLGAGSAARILDVRPQGPFDLVRVQVGEAVWRALAAPAVAATLGSAADVTLDPARTFVFAAEGGG